MNERQRRTLARIFARPTRSEIRWDELASLLRALGAEEHEGAGSGERSPSRGRSAAPIVRGAAESRSSSDCVPADPFG